MSVVADEVAMASRVLAADGHGHFCFGHVSGRGPDGFVIKAAGTSLAAVTAGDVARVDAGGVNLTPELRLHDETALHAAVYRARADVGGVVHTHSEAAQAATMLDLPNDVFSQDGVMFSGRLARFESAELINDPARGDAFASELGPGRAALLRCHGLVTVGRSIREATVYALTLDRALRTWLRAASAGVPRPIPATQLADLDLAFERAHDSRVADIWASAISGLCSSTTSSTTFSNTYPSRRSEVEPHG